MQESQWYKTLAENQGTQWYKSQPKGRGRLILSSASRHRESMQSFLAILIYYGPQLPLGIPIFFIQSTNLNAPLSQKHPHINTLFLGIPCPSKGDIKRTTTGCRCSLVVKLLSCVRFGVRVPALKKNLRFVILSFLEAISKGEILVGIVVCISYTQRSLHDSLIFPVFIEHLLYVMY